MLSYSIIESASGPLARPGAAALQACADVHPGMQILILADTITYNI